MEFWKAEGGQNQGCVYFAIVKWVLLGKPDQWLVTGITHSKLLIFTAFYFIQEKIKTVSIPNKFIENLLLHRGFFSIPRMRRTREINDGEFEQRNVRMNAKWALSTLYLEIASIHSIQRQHESQIAESRTHLPI